MSTETLNRRTENVQQAIASRAWLSCTYRTPGEGGEVVETFRKILPFRIYRSREDALVIDGFDTHRQAVRTFRLDRFARLALGEEVLAGDDPAVLKTRGGEVPVYPATWKLIQAKPQTISPKALDRFLACGWDTKPNADVLQPPA
jgi:predicted DNA-binding transcriptional regulator YafY